MTPPSGDGWLPPLLRGDQQPTGPPPAGQVGMSIGMQLTDVVETANASTSANKIFFPLVITGERKPGRHFPWRSPRKQRKCSAAPRPAAACAGWWRLFVLVPADVEPSVSVKTCCASCRCDLSAPRHSATPLLDLQSAPDCTTSRGRTRHASSHSARNRAGRPPVDGREQGRRPDRSARPSWRRPPSGAGIRAADRLAVCLPESAWFCSWRRCRIGALASRNERAAWALAESVWILGRGLARPRFARCDRGGGAPGNARGMA